MPDPDPFHISSDRGRMDVDLIHAFLVSSYWAPGIPREIVARAIDNSRCYGLFEGPRQIGFARLVTDLATFAYLADVFIVEEFRGRGLDKRLIAHILADPEVHSLRRLLLATRDAHALYRSFGFSELARPGDFMTIHRPDIYRP